MAISPSGSASPAIHAKGLNPALSERARFIAHAVDESMRRDAVTAVEQRSAGQPQGRSSVTAVLAVAAVLVAAGALRALRARSRPPGLEGPRRRRLSPMSRQSPRIDAADGCRCVDQGRCTGRLSVVLREVAAAGLRRRRVDPTPTRSPAPVAEAHRLGNWCAPIDGPDDSFAPGISRDELQAGARRPRDADAMTAPEP